MGKNVLEMRIGVRRADGFRSNLWKLWATPKSDTYLATRQMAAIKKYSFHAGGICRSAFTAQHGTPPTLSDRATIKWRRNPTPAAGSGQATLLARIAFPTDFLSRLADQDSKPVVWITAPPSGKAAILEVMYTAESEGDVIEAFSARGERKLIKYVRLRNGDSVAAVSSCADWPREHLYCPAGDPPLPGSVFPDLLFSANDPEDTGRPIRLIIGRPTPKDGDALELEELGGYPASEKK
jgi:hypothetical protein